MKQYHLSLEKSKCWQNLLSGNCVVEESQIRQYLAKVKWHVRKLFSSHIHYMRHASPWEFWFLSIYHCIIRFKPSRNLYGKCFYMLVVLMLTVDSSSTHCKNSCKHFSRLLPVYLNCLLDNGNLTRQLVLLSSLLFILVMYSRWGHTHSHSHPAESDLSNMVDSPWPHSGNHHNWPSFVTRPQARPRPSLMVSTTTAAAAPATVSSTPAPPRHSTSSTSPSVTTSTPAPTTTPVASPTTTARPPTKGSLSANKTSDGKLKFV